MVSMDSILVHNSRDKGSYNALSASERDALSYANISKSEVDKSFQLNGDLYLFRGTSPEFIGSSGARQTAVSATTDPFVATIFALEAKGQAGKGILHFGGKSNYGNFQSGNWHAVREREVGLNMKSPDFAQKSPYSITVEQSKKILDDMGFSVPNRINSKSDSTYIL